MSLTDRLRELVAFDTQNPHGAERPLVDHLARELGALGAASVEVMEAEGHFSVYARFGQGAGGARPRVLVNAHVDTVPANAGYTAPPLALRVQGTRLVGLGAADTKGAIAAVLEALAQRRDAGLPAPAVAVLFSGDEERRGTSMRALLAAPDRLAGVERAVVCEPTGCRVGWRHRGIAAAEASATSPGGHSSLVDEVPNPVAILARAAVALDDLGRRHRGVGPPGFQGLCLNVAALDGGLAFNVIPTRATLRLSLRPAPGADVAALLDEAERVARGATAPDEIRWTPITVNPAFQTRAPESFVPLLGEPARHVIDLGFWTEAALLGAAGVDAVVFGPGHIEQAHAPDEYVELGELEAARAAFAHLFAAVAAEAAEDRR
jgi:acetylornithine deacetylase